MSGALETVTRAFAQSTPDSRSAARAAIAGIFDQFRPPVPRFDTREFWGDVRLAAFELGVVAARLDTDGPVALGTVYRNMVAP
jgi:hypothetical protein